MAEHTPETEPIEDDEVVVVVVRAFGLDLAARDALFDRVAEAAHALDEQVMCSGSDLVSWPEGER